MDINANQQQTNRCGYCIKCKAKVALKNAALIYYKNGVPAEKGECSVCNSKVQRILTKQEKAELKAQKEVHNEQA